MTNPIVVWASDLHINSTVAVCVPEFRLDDDNYHKNSKAQTALWEAWLDAWGQIKRRSKGREVVTVFGGEIADMMVKHPTLQYITKNRERVEDLAIETIAPALDVTDKLIVLRGTEAHSDMSSNLDEAIAKRISKEYRVKVIKDGNRFSHYHARMFIGGRKFDFAHHVGMGTSKRSERDAANHLSADLMMTYSRWGEKFPDFAMRGHVHRVADSSMNYPIRSIICPSWQLHTTFSHRIGAGADKPEIGLIVVDPANQEVDWIRYEIKREEPKFI